MKKNKSLQRIKRRKFVSLKRSTSVVKIKMKLKKGDQVIVVSGKDKGKTGIISRVIPVKNQVVIDGVGMIKRHIRRTSRNQSGRIVERPAPINASNVMAVDPDTKKQTRIGREVRDGKLTRFTKKSKTTLK